MLDVLVRKWNTFRRDPATAIEHKFEIPLRWKLHGFWRTKLRIVGTLLLRRADCLRDINAFCSARPGGSYGPDFMDMWYLYKDIRARKPKVVVEFGSGVSTVVFALALEHNCLEGAESGILYSFESDVAWCESTSNSIPKRLRKFVQVKHASPVLSSLADGQAAWQYSTKEFEGPVDYVYVDGPPLTIDQDVSRDILDVEPCLTASARIVFDGRTSTKRTFLHYCQRRYVTRYRALWSNDFVADVV